MRILRGIGVAGVLGLALGSNALAQDGDVLTPHHVAKMRSVTSAQMSPDGTRVAYTLSVPRRPGVDEDGGAWAELHLLDVETGASRPYVSGKQNVSSVQWTPDGEGIAFLAKRGDDKHTSLYVLPVDGGEARRAAGLKTSIRAYSFSPDGSQVALVATEEQPKEVKTLKDKGFKQEIYEEEIPFARLWIVDAFDEEAEPRMLEIEGSLYQVHWSPVDTRIAVSLAPTPLVDDSYMRQRVRVVDSASGEILARLENPGKMGAVGWSPDGAHIAMVAAIDINDPAAGRLMVASSETGQLVDVLPGLMGHVSTFRWQNPEELLYVAGVGVWTVIGEARADAGESKEIVHGGPIVTGLSVSADGQSAALVANAPTHGSELFTMKHGESAPTRRTHSNPWLDDIRLAKQEVITYAARDGQEIEGLLIRPLDEVAGQRYPLILYVHGGPESHHSNGWLTRYSNPGQMAAAEGIAVFHTNYRGSTGRGVEFSKLSQADPAGKEFDDLVDAVDHLIEIGLVDKDKVAVTGGSYGGYATAWLSTYYSERFAAGVMFVGISNKVSKVGTTDIADEEYYVHARKRVQGNWKFFLERSPVYHAEKSRTPMLILHGKDDPRVNKGQSMEMYRHMKMHDNAPVRLVFYPGEGHGNRKAGARLDYSLRAMRWMDHYLKGPGGEPPAHELDYGLDDDKKVESEGP